MYFIWTDDIEIFLCYFETTCRNRIYTQTKNMKEKNKVFEYSSAIFMLESFHYFIYYSCYGYSFARSYDFFGIIQEWIDGNISFICFETKSLTFFIAIL